MGRIPVRRPAIRPPVRRRRRRPGSRSAWRSRRRPACRPSRVAPTSDAASATPCAWLPAEAATTPAAFSAADSRCDADVGAADLERPGALQVLALEEHRAADRRVRAAGTIPSACTWPPRCNSSAAALTSCDTDLLHALHYVRPTSSPAVPAVIGGHGLQGQRDPAAQRDHRAPRASTGPARAPRQPPRSGRLARPAAPAPPGVGGETQGRITAVGVANGSNSSGPAAATPPPITTRSRSSSVTAPAIAIPAPPRTARRPAQRNGFPVRGGLRDRYGRAVTAGESVLGGPGGERRSAGNGLQATDSAADTDRTRAGRR